MDRSFKITKEEMMRELSRFLEVKVCLPRDMGVDLQNRIIFKDGEELVPNLRELAGNATLVLFYAHSYGHGNDIVVFVRSCKCRASSREVAAAVQQLMSKFAKREAHEEDDRYVWRGDILHCEI